MDHWGINFGAGAFWLFIAAAAWGSHWEKARRNAEKHETLRRIIEKTGTVDEARLQQLFSAATPGSDWMSSLQSKPGDGYRALRISGTIVLSIAAGLAIFFLVMGQTGTIPETGATIGLAATSVFAMLGLGLFYSSRFAVPPPDRGNGSAR